MGKVTSRQALNEGRDFKLPDGSTLTLHFIATGIVTRMHVLRNGTPVPGSVSDPYTLVKNAYQALFYIAGVNIIIGLATAVFHITAFNPLSGGWISVAFGILFLILGFAVHEGWKPALKLGLLIFLVDSGFLLLLMLSKVYLISWAGVFLRGYLIFALIEGLQVIDQMNYIDMAKIDDHKRHTRKWTNVEKFLAGFVGLLVFIVAGLLYLQSTNRFHLP